MDKILDVFPLTGTVSKEAISKGNILDIGGCVGVHALRESMGENVHMANEITWGNKNGYLTTDQASYMVTTVPEVGMMDVNDPIEEITFYLKEI